MSLEQNFARIADALESIASSLASYGTAVPAAPAPTAALSATSDSGPAEAPKEKKTRAKKEAAPAPTMPAEPPAGHLQAANTAPLGTGTFAPISPIPAATPDIKTEALAFLKPAAAPAAPPAQPAGPSAGPAIPAVNLDSSVLAAVAPAPVPSFSTPAAQPAAAPTSGYDALLAQYPGALMPSKILDAETVAQLGQWSKLFSSATPAQQIGAITQLYLEFPGEALLRETLVRALSWFGQSLPISGGAAAPQEAGANWLAMPEDQRFIVYLQVYLAAAQLRAAAQAAGV